MDGPITDSMDVLLYYMKRCIVLLGDTVEIRKGSYWINGTRKDKRLRGGVGGDEGSSNRKMISSLVYRIRIDMFAKNIGTKNIGIWKTLSNSAYWWIMNTSLTE